MSTGLLAGGAGIALVVGVVGMLADIGMVLGGKQAMRRFTKPIGLAALTIAALSCNPAYAGQRAWFVAAFALSLAGDVFLLWEDRFFIPGLVSFLLGHVAFVVGFCARGLNPSWAMLGTIAVAVALAPIAPRLLKAIHEGPDPKMVGPVTAYMLVISAMAITAAGAGPWVAVVGAWLFMASDTTLAWNRFVKPSPRAGVVVMVTYFAAQVLLFLGLAA